MKPIFVEHGAGNKVNVLGNPITIKIHGRDTGGAFALVECSDPTGGGPPPHIHHREDETFYVLEGEYEIVCGQEKFTAKQGAAALLPRDVPHTNRNISNATSKILVTLTPAGFEQFFEEIGAMSPAEQSEIPRVMGIAQRYGLEFLPPKP